MTKVNDIPKQRIKDDSQFHSPIDHLINNIQVYYQTEHGVTVSAKQVEDQIIKILRSRL